MRYLILVLICLLFFKLSPAQDATPVYYSRLIKAGEIKNFEFVLASDSLEGRETGRPGQKKAAAFISNHFRSLHLWPASHERYYQDFPLKTEHVGNKGFEVNARRFQYTKDYFYPPGLADTLLAVDSLVFAGYGISDKEYDDYAGISVNHRAVIIYDGEPEKKGVSAITHTKEPSVWAKGWKQKVFLAIKKNVSLVLIVTDSLEKEYNELNNAGFTATYFGLFPPRFALITPEVAKAFFPEVNNERMEDAKKDIDRKSKPQSFGSKASAKLCFLKDPDQLRGQNVVGYLEGTDKKDELIIISAHYDHLGKTDSLIYHGADDDASGTSAVMELAQTFVLAARDGHRPRRSMLFMTFSGEEKGLLGSAYYTEHPLYPLQKTVADLNIDMIGRTDPKHDSLGVKDYVYIIGSDKLSTELHAINEKENETETKLQLDYTYNLLSDPNRFYYRSDHYNFAKRKIPIIFYFNGTHKDYHRPTDTYEKIDYNLLAKRAQLVFLTAWELANRSDRIKLDVKTVDVEKEEKK